MIHDVTSEKIRVLLVEDNSFLRHSLSDYLRMRDMMVTEVTSGAEFYSCFNPMNLDVAVIDVNLPDTSGFQLTASIREKSDIGVIILTARTKREDRIRGYGEGADIYLTKPVDTEELALAIGNLSRRRRNQVGPMPPSSIVKTAATWKLDRARHMLNTPGGVAVKLSTRETAFLEYLAARSNVVVSRIELAAIFGEDRLTSGSRVTDVALARLRARIRQAGTELPLQVIRNSGYKLVTTVVVN